MNRNTRSAEPAQSAERFKAFADAVIAIAMTLLILPLMESVSEAATAKLTTAEFLNEHVSQIGSFGLSFVLIAMFWAMHHRLYDGVEHITSRLRSINLLWLAAIVWLPVATAMVGQMEPDALQALLYVGTLTLASLLLAVMRIYLLRHPGLTTEPTSTQVRGLAANIALVGAFAVTLTVSMIWPGYGNYGFFLCLLIDVAARPLTRWLAPRFAAPETTA